MLNEILACPSVAGRTEKMHSLLKNNLSSLFDTDTTDILGSLYFTKKLGEGKRLLICCAIDTSGLIATFTDGTRINVSSIGGFHIGNMAFSKVNFEKAEGVLVPLGNLDFNAPITDFAVETGNEEKVKKVVLGDVGYFDTEMTLLDDGKISGFGAAVKACIYAVTALAKKLVANTSLLENEGIGEICFAFISHESLGNRGSSCVSSAVNPDIVINVSPIDMTEKNVGTLSFDDGFAVKMLDKSFVADEDAAILAEKLLDFMGANHKRRVSNTSYSSLSKLGLCDKGAKLVEICLPAKFCGTRGECVKKPFSV